MDLRTTYLGMRLSNPIVPSAGPLSHSIDSMKRLEDAGASAIVMYSLFEEQIAHDTAEVNHYLEYGTESFAESLTYFPDIGMYNAGPDEYVELVRKAKETLGIPVIGSLNGITAGGWISYARKIEQAGADALELNVYYIPTDPDLTAELVEVRYMEILHAVKESIRIPVAMKMNPFFTSLANVAHRLALGGADGLVLFNRFHQPDIDLDLLEVKPGVRLSTSDASRLPLRWIAILHGREKLSLAASGGIHTAEDAIKMIMAGADVTMMCSALLKNGPTRITHVLEEMRQWMLEHDYVSIGQMKGSMSHRSVADPAAFERANYMKALNSFGSGGKYM